MPKIRILKQFFFRKLWWTSAHDNEKNEIWGKGETKETSYKNLLQAIDYCNNSED